MSQDPFQALYSGIGGALLLHLTTIESIYPTVCVLSCVIVCMAASLEIRPRPLLSYSRHCQTLYQPFNLPMYIYGYGSIPINTFFRGMNIHLPATLMFTRGTRF